LFSSFSRRVFGFPAVVGWKKTFRRVSDNTRGEKRIRSLLFFSTHLHVDRKITFASGKSPCTSTPRVRITRERRTVSARNLLISIIRFLSVQTLFDGVFPVNFIEKKCVKKTRRRAGYEKTASRTKWNDRNFLTNIRNSDHNCTHGDDNIAFCERTRCTPIERVLQTETTQ